MIKSFAHKGLKRFFLKDEASGIQPEHRQRLRVLLTALNEAEAIEQMALPGADLHPLKHNLDGFWSIKVNANWRLIFRFEGGNAYIVDYLDYH